MTTTLSKYLSQLRNIYDELVKSINSHVPGFVMDEILTKITADYENFIALRSMVIPCNGVITDHETSFVLLVDPRYINSLIPSQYNIQFNDDAKKYKTTPKYILDGLNIIFNPRAMIQSSQSFVVLKS